MILNQGTLQISTGGERLVEEVAYGAVLVADPLGGGVGKQVPQSPTKTFPISPPPELGLAKSCMPSNLTVIVTFVHTALMVCLHVRFSDSRGFA
jgi:hypothetical protein